MANNVSGLKTACDNVTAVTKAAIKKEPLYLDAKFQQVTDVQKKATVQELFLELGKMYVTSKDSDKDATVSTILGRMKLITQNQETPEVHAKSAAIQAVISKAFQYLKTATSNDQAAFLQRTLSTLFLGKEWLIWGYRMAQGQLKCAAAEKERSQFFIHARVVTANKNGSDYHMSQAVLSAATRSLEAFAVFVSFTQLTKNTRQIEKGTEVKAIWRQLSPAQLEKLRQLKHSSNEDVRLVAQAGVSFLETDLAFREKWEVRKGYHQLILATKIQTFDQNPILLHLLPESAELCQLTESFAKQMTAAQMHKNPTFDLEPIQQKQAQCWSRFVASAESRYFVYELFYQMLQQHKTEAVNTRKFLQTYGKHLYSSILHHDPALPEPKAFTALTVEQPISASAALSADNKDQKTPFVPPQKKPPKKDPFFAYLSKESLLEQSNAKTQESVFTAAASPQTAAADPLTPVLAMGKSFITQRTYADRASIWLTDPTSAVEPPTYKSLSVQNKEAAQWRHGFTITLDQFLGTRYSVTGLWENPTTGKTDTLHCMVAEVEDESGHKERCVLQYCEDEKGVIYHRFAGLTSNQDLLDRVINQKLFEVLDFPALKVSKNAMQSGKSSKPMTTSVAGEKVTIDPHSDIVTVHDGKYKKTFRLIPLSD